MKDSHHGVSVNWLGYLYRFIVGKSATPFYYIVVLIQLTVITPRLVNVVKESKIIKNLLWLITPCYLLYIYVWNLTTGFSPRLYETLLPAWFGFYYLGINVRCGLKLKCSRWKVLIAWAVSCVEALALRKLGMNVGFYTSQITFGSFLYSVAVIGWILKGDLVSGKLVLFSGTGCQVNGLKKFLGKEYNNLICVDVICHGAPSPALWRKYAIYQEQKNGGKLKGINFRCKDDGWTDFGMKEICKGIPNGEMKKLYISKDKDAYMQMFLRDYCLRPSCYECAAKNVKMRRVLSIHRLMKVGVCVAISALRFATSKRTNL